MTILSLLPILIILIIVIIAAKSMKKTANNQVRSMSVKWVRRIFGAYISLLLICTLVVPFINGNGWDDLKKAPVKDLEKEGIALVNAAAAGKIDSIDRKFIEKKWDFDFREQKLTVGSKNNEFISTQIFVERKKTNDQKIEAVSYKTRSSVNDLDVTQLTNPIRLKLAANTLTINNPKKAVLEFNTFNHVFSVSQFTGEPTLFAHHSSFSKGQSILYLRIPKDLKLINKPDVNIQFVE
ncbi:hypothetical protein [Neobacillus drentensis]|uniref:hypothetical protein n=1 Tax=Neobacillus drentensis TaxID=220684 RepID=UPI0030005994